MPRRARTDAYAALVRQFQDLAVGYAFSRLGDMHLAEDASQEAFLEAWQSLAQLREPKAFAAWFRRIVLKRCDRLTRGKKPPVVPFDEAVAFPTDEPTPAEHVEAFERRQRVRDAVRALPEHERAATSLYYISGHTQAEIADFLETPLGTVKRRLHSARKRMKEGLTTMVKDDLRAQAPSRDGVFEERIARLIQPHVMRTADYQYGVDKVDGNDAWDLMSASAQGDLNQARALLRKDPRLVNAQHWYQFPIHFAVREGHAAVVKLLLDGGAEPGRSRYLYNSWRDLLVEAERRGHDEITELLEGALRQRYGYRPEFSGFAQAIRDRDRGMIEALLSVDPELVKAADVRGNNALHWAGMTHQVALIDDFLERGADINAERTDGQTPAMLTMNGDNRYVRDRDLPHGAIHDFWAVVDRLLDRGADYSLSIATMRGDERRVRELLDDDPAAARRLDACRRSYLHYAAAAQRADIASLFLDLGADPNMSEDLAPNGRALHTAAARSALDVARLLLKHGADPNADVDSSGTPVIISKHRDADGSRGIAIRKLLREHGAVTDPPNMTVDDMREALRNAHAPPHPGAHFADEQFIGHLLLHDSAELIRLLVETRPDALRTVPIPSPRYPTSPECAELALQHGLDPNATDWLGKTWLHFIARKNHVEVARAFVERGADVNAVEAEHRATPLAEAASRGAWEMVSFLLEQGADPCLPAEEWAQPLSRATENGHGRAAGLLRAAASLRGR